MELIKLKGCEFCSRFSCCDIGNSVCDEYEPYDDIDDAIIEFGKVCYRREFADYISHNESYDIYSIKE